MFEQQKNGPWYKSIKVIIGVLVAVILALGAFVFYYRRYGVNEAHYAELEQHRQQQAAQTPAAAPAATVAPVADASPGASPSPGAATPAVATGRNYWTTLRGPKRDGNYEATPVLTSWPSSGLAPIWKQPVGLGFASFAIADG